MLSSDTNFRGIKKKSLLIMVMAFFMMSFIINNLYAQALKKGPYLIYDNDNTRMEILWQDDMSSRDTIRWGKDKDNDMEDEAVLEYGLDHQHRIILTGLEPGTKYHYEVTVGHNSLNGSFFTAPAAGQSSLQFFAYGDSRTGVSEHNLIAGMINDCWMDDPASQTFILSMGDLTSDGNYENYWGNEMFNQQYSNIRHMLANIPFMAARGNHEGNGKLFAKYFPYPYFSQYYYSMDYGPVHVAFVDIYTRITPGSAQYNWLVNDLSHSESPWKFIVVHAPGWSAAGGHANNSLVQHIIEPLCEEFNVAILFAGHNHYYARAVVYENNGDSVIHITTGGGGGPLHTPQTGQPNVVTASRSHHFCKINIISDDLLQFSAISDSGEVIDQFVINRSITTISDHKPANLLTITPNPFKDNTLVEYTLDDSAVVKLSLFNMEGDKVQDLLPETRQSRGSYNLNIDGSSLPGGIYICKLLIMNVNGKADAVSCKVIVAK